MPEPQSNLARKLAAMVVKNIEITRNLLAVWEVATQIATNPILNLWAVWARTLVNVSQKQQENRQYNAAAALLASGSTRLVREAGLRKPGDHNFIGISKMS